MPDSGVFRKRMIKRQALGPPEAGGPSSGAGPRGAGAGRLVARPWGQACSATPRGGWRLEAARASRPWPGLQGDRDRRATGRRAAARPPPQQTNGPSVVGGPGPPAPVSADGAPSTVEKHRPSLEAGGWRSRWWRSASLLASGWRFSGDFEFPGWCGEPPTSAPSLLPCPDVPFVQRQQSRRTKGPPRSSSTSS